MVKKLNPLLSQWPTGVVYTASWLSNLGISPALTQKYCQSKWMIKIDHSAYQKYGDNVTWKGGICAIQQQLGLGIHPGGKIALNLLGYNHYLSFNYDIITLYGNQGIKLRLWFKYFEQFNQLQYFTTNLFKAVPNLGLTNIDLGSFSITISAPERAIMEVLFLVPHQQSFDEAWLLMEGLTTLRPNLVQTLLENCRSIKVKRLFMYMAETQNHLWFSHLEPKLLNFGSGKRVIVKSGVLDHKYLITIPSRYE